MRRRDPMAWVALATVLAFDAWHWSRIESPAMNLIGLGLLALLGSLPTVVSVYGGRLWGWLAALPAAAVAAFGAVTGIWPWHASGGYLSAVPHAINKGVHGWFSVRTPFDPAHAGAVDHDVRLVYFALAVAIAWLLVARRWTVPAIAVAFFGFAMPSTVGNIPAAGIRAAMFLALALLCLRVAVRPADDHGPAGSGQAAAAGLALVATAFVVAALPGVTKPAFLDWHSWNPLARAEPQVSVSYVWNQTYQPLHWPKQITTVFYVFSPKPRYWPVARLEEFQNGAWRSSERAADSNPTDPNAVLTVPSNQLPPRAVDHTTAGDFVQIKVSVAALADSHLVGAGQPLAWTPPSGISTTVETDGSAVTTAGHDIPRGAVYYMRGFVATPSFKQLEKAGTHFPAGVVSGITVGQNLIPPYPQADTHRIHLNHSLIEASNQVWTQSDAVSATNEWDAVAAVENYLRTKPFKYSQTTVYSGHEPVLAQFLLDKKAGYCQMYSGAMALVLRLHGIPARVVVGFTTGTKSPQGPYVVTDHDAHSWVEAYFPGWGWQEFDPTPTRSLPSGASMSNHTTEQDVAAQAARDKTNAKQAGGIAKQLQHLPKTPGAPPGGKGQGPATALGPAHKPWRPGFIAASLLVVLLAVVLTAIAKLASVRWRYLRRGPRAQAAAAYHELTTFVGDQGVPPASSRTFEELAHQVDHIYGVDAKAFARAASRARYGPEQGAEPAEQRMRRELRTIKKGVRHQLTIRERMLGAVRLRAAFSQATSID
jgi:Transglutaminase-like superfamily